MESYGLGRQWTASTLVSEFAVREGAHENRKKKFFTRHDGKCESFPRIGSFEHYVKEPVNTILLRPSDALPSLFYSSWSRVGTCLSCIPVQFVAYLICRLKLKYNFYFLLKKTFTQLGKSSVHSQYSNQLNILLKNYIFFYFCHVRNIVQPSYP